jgi:hypothetical protein
MNPGDVVRITSKRNTDLSVTGIVITPEDDMTWPVVKTMFDDKFIVYSDEYTLDTIKRVEPKTIGSIYTADNGRQFIRFRNREYGWIEVDCDALITYRWAGIAG